MSVPINDLNKFKRKKSR